MKKRERLAVEAYIATHMKSDALIFTAEDVVKSSQLALNVRAVRKALQNMAYLRLGLQSRGQGQYVVNADNVNIAEWREATAIDLKKIHRRRGASVSGASRKAARRRPAGTCSNAFVAELEARLTAIADEHFRAKREAFTAQVKKLVAEFLS